MRSFLSQLLNSPIPRVASVLLIGLVWSSLAFGGEIHDAAGRGDLEKVKALLKDNPALVFSKANEPLLYTATPLGYAASYGRTDVVEFLLSNKAEVNARDINGQTPLFYAALQGHEDVVQVLLAHGADVDAKDKNGQTPLYNAVSHRDVVEVLLAHGADVNNKARDGQTPLHYAVGFAGMDVVQVMLTYKADVNAKDNYGHTPLYDAQNNDVVELLRKHGSLDASARGDENAGQFNGSVLNASPKSPEDNRRAFQASDLVKQGISPLSGNAQFTSADGIVYSNVELDRVTGTIYLTSPKDKQWKIAVSGFDTGKLTFTRVAQMPASTKLANGASAAATAVSSTSAADQTTTQRTTLSGAASLTPSKFDKTGIEESQGKTVTWEGIVKDGSILVSTEGNLEYFVNCHVPLKMKDATKVIVSGKVGKAYSETDFFRSEVKNTVVIFMEDCEIR
jgi:hypothetical protein